MGASGRMSYYTTNRCEARNHDEICEQAKEHQLASSKSAAATIAQKYGVRYSELLRLPYFDIVRMTTTDPMHTFLLGMVRRETELNLEYLSSRQRQEFIRRVKSVRIPYDVGRLPTNIFDNSEGSSGITANQWKVYITCYARPCMYKLLPERPYKCLVLLSEIITIMVSPVFTIDGVSRLYRLLHEHHRLFRRVYGKWSLSVNYHMSLHLPEIVTDLGPPHSFWCFGYERMNGSLAGTPNSNRSIEVEVANRFARDSAFTNSDIMPRADIPRSLYCG